MKTTSEIISLNSFNSLKSCHKVDLDRALSELIPQVSFDNYTALRNLQYLLDLLLKDDAVKEKVKEEFLERFGGSSKEEFDNYIIGLRNETEYEYSEEVKNLENEAKLLKNQITQMKEKQRKDGTAKKILTKETLTYKIF